MEIKEILKNIEGIDERFAQLILKYIENYIDMSSNKSLVANNIVKQIKQNIKSIQFNKLDDAYGSVAKIGTTIELNKELKDWELDNAFYHEFTHQISKNTYSNGTNLCNPNSGLKVGIDSQLEYSMGFRLKNWEVDGNNYAYNQGIDTLDEWITEWLANKNSKINNVEIKKDKNGFFRKKTSHGYDGSNVINLLELVYGSENVANLITGFDLNEEERKSVIPIKEFKKLNEMIDSNIVLTEEEKEIFKNLKPPYMKIPNITGLLVYYISEYQKQDKLEDYNYYIQKIQNTLIRAYTVNFNQKIHNCRNEEELNLIYKQLSVIQNSMIWHEDEKVLNSLETYQNFNKMRNTFTLKHQALNIKNENYNSLYLTPNQLLEKFQKEQQDSEVLKINYNIANKK